MDLRSREDERTSGFIGVQTQQQMGHDLPSFRPLEENPK
jgi:hypothetical protein